MASTDQTRPPPQASDLPDHDSPTIYLTRPTKAEQLAIWTSNFTEWAGPLDITDYLERENYLTSVPLSADGGITHWILVDSTSDPDRRQILASCESLRKAGIVRHGQGGEHGRVEQVVVYGIGSVFCRPDVRGRGYAGRMMRELGEKLRGMGEGGRRCGFSVLWSDIGPSYYARFGWRAYSSSHVEFRPTLRKASSGIAKVLETADLKELCQVDVEMIKRGFEKDHGAEGSRVKVAVLPDWEHMQWHHMREDFLCGKLFGKKPVVRGAVAGDAGERIWAVWTRSFYGPVGVEKSGNTLHILRLVIEGETSPVDEAVLKQGAECLKAIMEVAQSEAAQWKLNHVELWNPTPFVQALVERTGLAHSSVQRDAESIASLKWYGEDGGVEEEIEWVGNEKYGWC